MLRPISNRCRALSSRGLSGSNASPDSARVSSALELDSSNRRSVSSRVRSVCQQRKSITLNRDQAWAGIPWNQKLRSLVPSLAEQPFAARRRCEWPCRWRRFPADTRTGGYQATRPALSVKSPGWYISIWYAGWYSGSLRTRMLTLSELPGTLDWVGESHTCLMGTTLQRIVGKLRCDTVGRARWQRAICTTWGSRRNPRELEMCGVRTV